MTSDLARLAKPFHPRLVQRAPKGNASYVSHAHVTAKLLAVVGPYDTRIVEVIRGHAQTKRAKYDKRTNELLEPAEYRDDVVVGCILEMTVTVDGRTVTVTEAGDCEAPENWAHDGARLKNARSDAEKRCAMRLGVALDLWSKGSYFLPAALANQDDEPEPDEVADVGDPDEVRNAVTDDQAPHREPEPHVPDDEIEDAEVVDEPAGPTPGQLRQRIALIIKNRIGDSDQDRRHALAVVTNAQHVRLTADPEHPRETPVPDQKLGKALDRLHKLTDTQCREIHAAAIAAADKEQTTDA